MAEKNTSIVTVTIQKGGAGKTTCAVNLAASYAHLGRRVLLIDLDFQANATQLLGVEPKSLPQEKNICYAIEKKLSLAEAIVNTKMENIDLLPSSEKLYSLSQSVLGKPEQNFLLHSLLSDKKIDDYDLVIIDTNPNPDALFQSALTISHYYLVPVFPENDVIDGLATVFKNAETIKKYLNPKLTFLGCVIQKFDKDSPAHLQNEKILRKLSKESKIPVFQNIIPFSKAVYSASNAHTPLINYLKSSSVSKSYLALAGEIKPLLKGGRIGRPQTQITLDVKRYAEMFSNDDVACVE